MPVSFTDLTFVCKDGSIAAHKAIVAYGCPLVNKYLRFYSESSDEDTKIILPDVSRRHLQKFLEILYTGSVDFTELRQFEIVNKLGQLLLEHSVMITWDSTLIQKTDRQVRRPSRPDVPSARKKHAEKSRNNRAIRISPVAKNPELNHQEEEHDLVIDLEPDLMNGTLKTCPEKLPTGSGKTLQSGQDSRVKSGPVDDQDTTTAPPRIKTSKKELVSGILGQNRSLDVVGEATRERIKAASSVTVSGQSRILSAKVVVVRPDQLKASSSLQEVLQFPSRNLKPSGNGKTAFAVNGQNGVSKCPNNLISRIEPPFSNGKCQVNQPRSKMASAKSNIKAVASGSGVVAKKRLLKYQLKESAKISTNPANNNELSKDLKNSQVTIPENVDVGILGANPTNAIKENSIKALERSRSLGNLPQTIRQSSSKLSKQANFQVSKIDLDHDRERDTKMETLGSRSPALQHQDEVVMSSSYLLSKPVSKNDAVVVAADAASHDVDRTLSMAANQSFSENAPIFFGKTYSKSCQPNSSNKSNVNVNRKHETNPDVVRSGLCKCTFCSGLFQNVRSRNLHIFKYHQSTFTKFVKEEDKRSQSPESSGRQKKQNHGPVIEAKATQIKENPKATKIKEKSKAIELKEGAKATLFKENPKTKEKSKAVEFRVGTKAIQIREGAKPAQIKADPDPEKSQMEASVVGQSSASAKKRGRKRLPRDENGQIIRDPNRPKSKNNSSLIYSAKITNAGSMRGRKRKNVQEMIDERPASKRAKLAERGNDFSLDIVKQEPDVFAQSTSSDESVNSNRFSCSNCSLKFSRASKLAEHYKDKHYDSIEYEMIRREIKKKINKASNQTRSMGRETRDLPRGEDEEDCQTSGAKKQPIFYSEESLLRLSVAFVVLDKIEMNGCKNCSRIFVSSEALQIHVKSAHAKK